MPGARQRVPPTLFYIASGSTGRRKPPACEKQSYILATHDEINMCGARCQRRKKKINKRVSLKIVFMHFELLTSVNKFINNNQITEMRVMFHQSAARVQKMRPLPDISRPAEAFITDVICCALIPFPEVTRGALELKALPFESGQLALHLCAPPTPHLYRETVCGGCP